MHEPRNLNLKIIIHIEIPTNDIFFMFSYILISYSIIKFMCYDFKIIILLVGRLGI